MFLRFTGESTQSILWTMSGEDWKKATGEHGKLAKHERSASHLQAADAYKARVTPQSSVAVHLSKAHAENVQRLAAERAKNRSILRTIIDIIRLLARQNVSFRGDDESNDSTNRGNFLEFVHFTARYNSELKNWLEYQPGNISWLSPQIQNELLHCLAEEVTATVVNECKGRLFSILCDEVSDRSNCELLSLVVRFVDDAGAVRECLLALIQVDSTSAFDLCDVILEKLKKIVLIY